jgi:hypothetical protein
MRCQTHHPNIVKGHGSGREEQGRYQQCGEAFSPHFHFDDAYEDMFGDKRFHWKKEIFAPE